MIVDDRNVMVWCQGRIRRECGCYEDARGHAMTRAPDFEPIDIYRSERGIWHAKVRRGGVLRWFSLHTRDEAAARRRWAEYLAEIERARGARQLREVGR